MAAIMELANQIKLELIGRGLESSSTPLDKTMFNYLRFSKITGYFYGFYSVAVYCIYAYNDFQNGNNINGIGNILNAGMSIYMTIGGFLGLYGGGVYFLINETIGWQEMGRRQRQVIQNNQYWWQIYTH